MHVSRARSAAAVVAALGLALPLGGCAVGEAHRSPDEALASVQDAGDQAASAVATVRAAIALFGAAMTPYEVFFFSSGAVEEGWTSKDLSQSRVDVLVGFPLGGLLSLAIAGCAAVVLRRGRSPAGTAGGTAAPSWRTGPTWRRSTTPACT